MPQKITEEKPDYRIKLPNKERIKADTLENIMIDLFNSIDFKLPIRLGTIDDYMVLEDGSMYKFFDADEEGGYFSFVETNDYVFHLMQVYRGAVKGIKQNTVNPDIVYFEF